MAKKGHEHNDFGRSFQSVEKTKTGWILWTHTCCTCGHVMYTDRDRTVHDPDHKNPPKPTRT